MNDKKHVNNILHFLRSDTLTLKASEVPIYNICITFLHSLLDDENGKKAKEILEQADNGKERKV